MATDTHARSTGAKDAASSTVLSDDGSSKEEVPSQGSSFSILDTAPQSYTLSQVIPADLTPDQTMKLECLLAQVQSGVENLGSAAAGQFSPGVRTLSLVEAAFARYFYDHRMLDELPVTLPSAGSIVRWFVNIDDEKIKEQVESYRQALLQGADKDIASRKAQMEQDLVGRRERMERDLVSAHELNVQRVTGEISALASRRDVLIKEEQDSPIEALRARVAKYSADARAQILEDLVAHETARWFAPVFDVARALDGTDLADKDYFLTEDLVSRWVRMLFDADKNLDKFPLYPIGKDGAYKAFLLSHLPEPFVLRVQAGQDELEKIFRVDAIDACVGKCVPGKTARISAQEYDSFLAQAVSKERMIEAVSLVRDNELALLERLSSLRAKYDSTLSATVSLIKDSLAAELGHPGIKSSSAATVEDFVKGIGKVQPKEKDTGFTDGEVVFHPELGFGEVYCSSWNTFTINFRYNPKGQMYKELARRDVPKDSLLSVAPSLEKLRAERGEGKSSDDLAWVPAYRKMGQRDIVAYATRRVDELLASRSLSRELVSQQFGFLSAISSFHPHLEAEREFKKGWFDAVLRGFEGLYK